MWPEQLLQRRLLDQLQALPGWSEVDPDTLLADYRDLQMMALYNGPEGDSGDNQQAMQAVGDVMVPVGEKGKKGFDRDMEEFLVQQVRTADSWGQQLVSCLIHKRLQVLAAGPIGCIAEARKAHHDPHPMGILQLS